MAYQRTHVISADETIQDIATQQLQDISRWTEIVELNDLVYPYIVSAKDKLKNPEHLMAIGDIIKLPSINSIRDLSVDTMEPDGKKIAYDTSLGMDLGLIIENSTGLDDNIAYLTEEEDRSDIKTVKGLYNLKQSITMRIFTRIGTLPYHPNYGSHIYDYIGKPLNPDTVALLKIELARATKTDGRVKKASVSEFYADGNSFFAVLEITPLGETESFEMFVEKAQNGNVRMG